MSCLHRHSIILISDIRDRSIDPTSTIVVSEPAAIRRQFALKHGATIAHNPLEKDIVSVVLEATGGEGVEKAFDAAGIQPSIDACLGSLRSRGTIVLVAIWEHPAKIDPMTILLKELFLTGVLYRLPRCRLADQQEQASYATIESTRSF